MYFSSSTCAYCIFRHDMFCPTHPEEGSDYSENEPIFHYPGFDRRLCNNFQLEQETEAIWRYIIL